MRTPVFCCHLIAAAALSGGEAPLPPGQPFYAPPPSSEAPPAVLPTHPRPNIIMLIGDGMGLNAITAARRAAGGPDVRLALDRMPIVGLALTHSSNSTVTDSAAAGTALSAGVKTRNGVVGLDAESRDRLTLLEGLRRSKGYRTGLVVTKNVTDATPAAYVAEVPSRKQEELIAIQLVAEQVDVVFGGGLGFFLPQASGGKRSDGRDLVAEARTAGTNIARDATELAAMASLPVLGLFSPGNMDSTRAEQPSIATMSAKALELLSADGKPFFLMIEGSQIDLAGHANDAPWLVRELLHFDQAVHAACTFAAKRQDTVVVVTSDHETGGLMLFHDQVHWASGAHSGSPVGVFACGAGAAAFSGTMDNTEIPIRLARLAGLTPFPALDAIAP